MLLDGYRYFIRSQWTHIPPVTPLDLEGRTVIVTGGNAGLGLEVARHFARMKAHVVMAVRSLPKGESAKHDIHKTVLEANISVWKLDMSDIESVRDFAKRAATELERLDCLILNAGVHYDYWEQINGFETTLLVNVITTGLLALLLLPLIKKTARLPAPSGSKDYKPHLTAVGSGVHYTAKFPEGLEDHPIAALNDASRFDPVDRYDVSKLLLIFVMREVASRVQDNSIICNTVNPGLCWSGLASNATIFYRIWLAAYRIALARTAEVGARTIVHAALTFTPNAAYLSDCQVASESGFSRSAEGLHQQSKVWADLCEIWKEHAPEFANLSS